MSHVPSPADGPTLTAHELLAKVREHGGRIYRMRIPPVVFCLTDDPKLASWLIALGAAPFASAAQEPGLPRGVYRRERGSKVEYDLYLQRIPVIGETLVWDAAA
jgi:hypothetical protein